MNNKCYVSIDLEDFSYDYQRSAGVKNPIYRPEAINLAVQRIIDTIAKANGSNKVTFFSTGHLARNLVDIVKSLSDDGHEIGCHNFNHINVHSMSRSDFASDLDKAIESIEGATGKKIYGFRAPNFSINLKFDWALKELSKRFVYDSSLALNRKSDLNDYSYSSVLKKYKIYEFPVFSYNIFSNINVRVIGGTYFKILPYWVIIFLMRRSIEAGFLPLIYLHPHEFLYDNELRVSYKDLNNIPFYKKIYYLIRQNQWISFKNKYVAEKLIKVLEVFPHQGTMVSYLLKNKILFKTGRVTTV